MMPTGCCLADIGDPWPAGTLGPKISLDPQLMIVAGVILVVAAAVFFWAAFIRKRGSHPHHRIPGDDSTHARRSLTDRIFGRRRHRHRRRERRRNPTLAEAGGLPPVRDEDSPQSH